LYRRWSCLGKDLLGFRFGDPLICRGRGPQICPGNGVAGAPAMKSPGSIVLQLSPTIGTPGSPPQRYPSCRLQSAPNVRFSPPTQRLRVRFSARAKFPRNPQKCAINLRRPKLTSHSVSSPHPAQIPFKARPILSISESTTKSCGMSPLLTACDHQASPPTVKSVLASPYWLRPDWIPDAGFYGPLFV